MMSGSNNAWRLFEKLAAQIERTLAPNGAVVRCPDYIPDVDTSEPREVDASIRYKIGTVEILIILECRYRKSTQGTMWIEQLASKRDSVGASKCVAISSSKFSKPAIKKANKLGIELRTLHNFDDYIINNMAPMTAYHFLYKPSNISLTFSKSIETNDKELVLDKKLNNILWYKYKHKIEDKILRTKGSGEKISTGEYILHLMNIYYSPGYESDKFIPEIGTAYGLSYAGETSAWVEIDGKEWDIAGAAFLVRFKYFLDYSMSFKKLSVYSDMDGKLAGRIGYMAETTDSQYEQEIVFRVDDEKTEQ